MKVLLRTVAHSRSGDKGNISNITVIAYNEIFYEIIKRQITSKKVAKHFAGVINGSIVRYNIDRLSVLNFVCSDALDGGVSRSLRLDSYGKSFSSAILMMKLEIPDSLESKIYPIYD